VIVPLAHAAHWIVNVAYFAPVILFLVWLAWVRVKDRRNR
jgi:uncharacterized membrane protein YtjA (UPF0391 family)